MSSLLFVGILFCDCVYVSYGVCMFVCVLAPLSVLICAGHQESKRSPTVHIVGLPSGMLEFSAC